MTAGARSSTASRSDGVGAVTDRLAEQVRRVDAAMIGAMAETL